MILSERKNAFIKWVINSFRQITICLIKALIILNINATPASRPVVKNRPR
jgi:hypothetical protein